MLCRFFCNIRLLWFTGKKSCIIKVKDKELKIHRYCYSDAYFVQLGQIENGVNEGAVHWNAKTAFSFTPSSILT